MNYTEEDTICPHCGGKLTPHSAGIKVIIWCDDCGSNDSKSPPSISVSVV